MENRKVVLYMRLSIEDSQSGSMSLTTQQQILEDKLLDMPEYEHCEVLHLVDNGHSGTTFDRPAMNTLMELVKQREIACIFIKDFSRLGRDMLQVGYLTESVFPLFYTRLVAVNDNFDSNNHYESTGGLEVTFRYLMAETYSKDLGKKISASKKVRIEKGEFVRINPFYGYKLDENRHYAIDDEAADTVRLIFDLALQGLIPTEIVRELYQRKIETPSQRKRKVNPYYKVPANENVLWTRPAIRNILQDKRYIGTYDAGFRKVVNTANKKTTKVRERDRVCIPNHHPAIISPEVFEQVQKLFPKKERTTEYVPRMIPLKGKMFCGICNLRLIIYTTSPIQIYCADKYKIDEFACSKTKISEKVLNAEVLKNLKAKIKEVVQELEDLPNEQLSSVPQCSLRQSIESLKYEKKNCYESLVAGTLTKEDFLAKKQEIDLQVEKLTLVLKTTQKTEQEVASASSTLNTLREQAKEINRAKVLTVELAEKFVKKVIVFPDNSLKMEFMFEDYLENK